MEIETAKLRECFEVLKNQPSPAPQLKIVLSEDKMNLYRWGGGNDFLHVSFPIEGGEEKEIIVYSKTFEQIVDLCQDEKMQMNVSDNLHLETSMFSYNIKGLEKEIFTDKTIKTSNLPSVKIENTSPLLNVSTARDKTNRVSSMMGVLLELSDGKLKVGATDQYRIFTYEGDVESKSEAKAVVPYEFLHFAGRVKQEKVVYFSDNSVILEADNILYESGTIAGDFPNIYKLISEHETVFETVIQQEEASWALRRLETVDATVFTLEVEKGGNVLTMRANGNYGKAEETIKCSPATQSRVQNFNIEYFLNGISPASADVYLQFGEEENSPLMIAYDNYKYYLAAVRNA